MELIKSREGFAPFGSYQTWYRITGDLEGGRTPLVILHGGPGCTYDYVDAYKDVAAGGYPVIHYDQLGNGRSTHLRDMPPSFWTVSLFLEELDNLLEHLGISDRYALLGQSWGGMLGSVHAARRPAGLRCLVIANSPVDMGVWMEEANRLRQELPEEIQATLLKHEATGDYMAADYLAATRFFYNKHVCRLSPWPEEVERTFAQVDADPTVYHAMTGPNEFTITGSTKDWSIADCLPQINVPSLLISGRYDEATPRVIQPFLDLVPGIQSAIFENSSHMPHVEERVACMGTVVNFLDHSL